MSLKLKTIHAVGFKSFADPITIPIRSSLCAIVGPNGCGKSNVIDAVRWVIGESSAKQLRGKSMADVIFNGSNRRQPMGFAQVELLFDNQDGSIGGQYAQYAELSIRRRVERDGQSNYYINNTPCRRRDVLDIFMGTGLGPRSYAIIEQGMVSRLVEARPDDLRVFIEEAAGVSKYKERRREAENRIKHTRENLERVDDLLDELERQKRSLTRQASAAVRYQELTKDTEQKSAQLKAMQWQEFSLKSKDYAMMEQTVLTEFESYKAKVASCEAELEVLQESVEEDQQQHQDIQQRYFATGSEVARLEQKLQHQQEQIAQWEQEIAADNSRIYELRMHNDEYDAQITELQNEIDTLGPQKPQLQEDALQTKEKLELTESALNDWQQSWEEVQSDVARAQQEIQVSCTKINNSEQQLSRLQMQQQHWQQENTASEQLGEIEEALAEAQEQTAMVEEQQLEAEQQLQQWQEKIQQQRTDNATWQEQQHSLQAELQSSQGQYTSLEALQQAALGKDDAQLQTWLEDKNMDAWPRLAEQLQVEPTWERVVERVLRPFLTAICCQDEAAFNDMITAAEAPSEGQLMFVKSDKEHAVAANNSSIGLDPLSAKVTSPWSLGAVLDAIYIADSRQQALEFSSKLAAHESIVTQDGAWFGAGWVQLGEENDPRQGRLQRQQLLISLQETISQLQQKAESLQQQLAEGRENILNYESNYSQQRTDLNQIQQKMSQSKSEAVVLQGRLDEVTRNQEKAAQQLQLCSEQIAQQEEDLELARADEITAKDDAEQAQERKQSLELLRDECREGVRQAQARAQHAQQKVDEFEIRLTANENQKSVLQKTLDRERKQLSSLEERYQQVSDKLEAAQDPDDILGQQLEELLEQRLVQDKELQESSAKMSEIEQQRQHLVESRKQAQRQVEEQQTILQDRSLQQKEVSIRQQTLLEQLHADGHDSVEDILSNMPEDADAERWQNDLDQNATRISRLGAINLAAIDELEEVSERHTHLDSQSTDLQKSLEILESAIEKIDKESKQKFSTTFDAVNERLQKLFPTIFEGGQAYLELVDQTDISSGVMIRAQPPGKRNTTIQMLSGGEKALTAIALVFAMFQLNPAPFCILDEVDAPLDDVNVGRYCEIVKKMSAETQFLVISHSKITMSIAGQLLGITMQEPGVSRLVAVDMDEAVEMIDA